LIVVDASALAEVVLRTPAGEVIEERLFDPRESLHAPHLIDVEVAQVIRRSVALGVISPQRGMATLATLGDLALRRYSHSELLPRVWELRNNLTAYDATYVALAEILDAPLLTRDRRLAAAPGHVARIEVI
jgi:predicted nucleic acid-binding protein